MLEFDSPFWDNVAPRDGMITDGTRAGSSVPALVWHPSRRVYYGPGFIGPEFGATGDWVAFIRNMIICEDAD